MPRENCEQRLLSFRLSGLSLLTGVCLLASSTVCLAQNTDEADLACQRAAVTSQNLTGVSRHILAAISDTETGSPAYPDGWPYTVDLDGAGYRFADVLQAKEFVAYSLRHGARFIDVGCFQIDLEAHPDAFADLDQAFSPEAGALYASGMLLRFYIQDHSWEAAIAAYHSMNWQNGLSYQAKVISNMGVAASDLDTDFANDTSGQTLVSVGPELPKGSLIMVGK